MITALKKVSGRLVPYQIVARRLGDIVVCYADVNKARKVLGWQACRQLEQMCADAWRWQHLHPDGFGTHYEPHTTIVDPAISEIR